MIVLVSGGRDVGSPPEAAMCLRRRARRGAARLRTRPRVTARLAARLLACLILVHCSIRLARRDLGGAMRQGAAACTGRIVLVCASHPTFSLRRGAARGRGRLGFASLRRSRLGARPHARRHMSPAAIVHKLLIQVIHIWVVVIIFILSHRAQETLVLFVAAVLHILPALAIELKLLAALTRTLGLAANSPP